VKVAYQGAQGAFAELACLEFLPGCEPVPFPSFGAVAAAVAGREVERGVLPLENRRAGPVDGVREAIAEHSLAILSEHWLPIRVHLLALPGATLEGIGSVVSHPMALRQCAASLAALGVAGEEADNTALAARALSSPDRAALASEAAARAFGLAILRRDLQDDPANATRFAVVGPA
jgi:prephenate dehydratase